MIQDTEVSCKGKKYRVIREKILASIGKYPRYPKDLYDACGRGLLLSSEFRDLLSEMQASGEICINANNLVVLPKPLDKKKKAPVAAAKGGPPPLPTPTKVVEKRPDEILIDCLVNRSRSLKHPKQKKSLRGSYYDHSNYKTESIRLDRLCEETLLKGFHLVPGSFQWLDKQTRKHEGTLIERKVCVTDGVCVSELKSADKKGRMREGAEKVERVIKDKDAWGAQQFFLIEFDDVTENALAEFIAARPFLKANAWLVTESIRSGYNDPDDATCNGQLRLRVGFCMPRAVETRDEHDWVYTALENELPGCDTGSANSITNGGLGRKGAAYIKVGNIVDTDWFNRAIDTGRKSKQAAKAAKKRAAAERNENRAERASMGFTERAGEFPLEVLAKTDPTHFLESLGLSVKSESGRYQHWGRPEKQGDTALSVWVSGHGNWQVRVFAQSIPIPGSVTGAMPLTRFYCYHELDIDIEGLQPDTAQWKAVNAELASRGYGTWVSDAEFKSHRQASEPRKERQRRRVLKITEDVSDTFVTLEDNEQAILDAFRQGIRETDIEIPHYLILAFEMGSGKNHALLTTLVKLKKRGIAIFENHDQVDEQVNKADVEFGLRSMGFRGRSYLFTESGLSAFPVKMRQQMRDLFDKHQVMCGFYDQIEKRARKGLGAYDYCLGCPFFKQCPYLEQFQLAAEMDFLALCVQDLFFDPSLSDFLQRISRRGEETEAEALIGAALGVKTETGAEFDFGVVDEVVARNLYLSYSYGFQVFEELASVWQGEAVGDFFTEMLRCLRSEETDPLSAVKMYVQALDAETRRIISEQMTKIPKEVSVHEHLLHDKDTHEVLAEYYAVDNAKNEWVIPVSPDAEQILRRKKVSTLGYQKKLPHSKIGVSPYSLLNAGEITISEIKGRLWSKGWTLLEQLEKAVKLDVQWIGMRYNARGEAVCSDELTLTIPPQVNPSVKRLVLMGGTVDVENIRASFAEQRVKISVEEGKIAEYKPGVQTYQYTGGRVTHQSVFVYREDADGKTIYDPETNAPVVIGIKPTVLKDLRKICELAERHIAEGNLKPVFNSYKDFTEPPIVDLPIVQRMYQCLQVKHFDMTRGLNFEDVKIFLVYGYPKSAHPDIIRQTAETLHHADPDPLDFTYGRCDEITDGYQAYQIGKYKDPRVEAVRQQLTRDKSHQAVCRARPTRWPDTITIHFSAEPIPGWTERSTEMERSDLHRASSFEELGARIAERTALTGANSITDWMRVYGCSYEYARRLWIQAGGKQHQDAKDAQDLQRILKLKAQHPQLGERKIAKQLSLSYGGVRKLLRNKPR